MNKKVGRNDPCSCGSGKKFKKCCEEKLLKKRFTAAVLSQAPKTTTDVSQKASKISTNFFERITAPKPKQPEHQPPHDHPDKSLPM